MLNLFGRAFSGLQSSRQGPREGWAEGALFPPLPLFGAVKKINENA